MSKYWDNLSVLMELAEADKKFRKKIIAKMKEEVQSLIKRRLK